MFDRIVTPAFLAAAFALALVHSAPAAEPAKKADSVLAFQVKDIDGNLVDLAKYKGEVLLIVNTASFCGNTPQYKGLEDLYQKYKSRGFEVLAFPANEFGRQEPKDNPEIKAFCKTKFNVTFPLFSKIVVQGDGIHPLYRYLTSPETDPKHAGDISWNFAKFLVDRKGQVIDRFAPGEKPESEKVVRAIEAALAEPK